MDVAIITTRRQPSYLLQTLHSYYNSSGGSFLDGPRIFTDQCDHWPLVPQDQIRHMDNRLQNLSDSLKPGFKRARLNFLSALLHGYGDIMLFEDDVVIRPDWRGVVALLSKVAPLVSLYFPTYDDLEEETLAYEAPPPEDPFAKIFWSISDAKTGPSYRFYKRPLQFHGSLGLFVKGSHRWSLVDYLVNHLHDQLPFDNTVSHWAEKNDVRMVASIPARVDHVGEVSAIPENQDHGPRRSPGW